MDVTPLVKSGQQIIQSYSHGMFKISGAEYNGAVIVRPSGTQLWDVQNFEGLVLESFTPLFSNAAEIDVVLLGTGAAFQFMPPVLKNALSERGLSVDVMDSGAACRTYNVLMAEGRRVVAALLPAI